ncbi:MAG: hypothetical protein ACXWWC_02390 [Chitinophagaceae bacterium]
MLLVCGISLHFCDFSNPAKKDRTGQNHTSGDTKTSRAFTYKKGTLSVVDHPDDSNTGIFFHQLRRRSLYPGLSHYTAGQKFFLSASCYVSGKAISTREVERVLKDHLLHLFPSHYFW